MISTREFVIDDYDKAVTLWSLVEGVEVAEGDSKEEIRAYLLRNPGLSRVAEENGTIVGAVLCGHDGRRGLIYHLAVAPASHGKGIGKLLVRECLTHLRATGIVRHSRHSNACYEKSANPACHDDDGDSWSYRYDCMGNNTMHVLGELRWCDRTHITCGLGGDQCHRCTPFLGHVDHDT